MINLYGSIGYSLLKNQENSLLKNHGNKLPDKILVLADMHSQLSYCSNYQKISDWLFSKISNSNILLEEVPRDNVELKGLFDKSDHTRDLKNLFLKNPDIIHALDIRPFLIPFSWEIIQFNSEIDIKLVDYLKLIDNFYSFNHIKFKELLDDIYTQEYVNNNNLKLHYDVIKNSFITEYKEKYRPYLDKHLSYLFKENIIVLEKLNKHLDNIMEYFIISKIYQLKKDKKNIIIHAGLAHSEKVIFWLEILYNYKIELSYGLNKIDDIHINIISDGCLQLPKIIDKQF
jgi:hypothetical protein